jgi:hypothetical protein
MADIPFPEALPGVPDPESALTPPAGECNLSSYTDSAEPPARILQRSGNRAAFRRGPLPAGPPRTPAKTTFPGHSGEPARVSAFRHADVRAPFLTGQGTASQHIEVSLSLTGVGLDASPGPFPIRRGPPRAGHVQTPVSARSSGERKAPPPDPDPREAGITEHAQEHGNGRSAVQACKGHLRPYPAGEPFCAAGSPLPPCPPYASGFSLPPACIRTPVAMPAQARPPSPNVAPAQQSRRTTAIRRLSGRRFPSDFPPRLPTGDSPAGCSLQIFPPAANRRFSVRPPTQRLTPPGPNRSGSPRDRRQAFCPPAHETREASHGTCPAPHGTGCRKRQRRPQYQPCS